MNATPDALVFAVEENLFGLFRAMAITLPGGELTEGSQVSGHHAFPLNPMFKDVWRTRVLAGEVDSTVDRALAWFRARNAPFAFWWTGPGTEPHDLGAHLMRRRFLDMEGQQRDLARGIVQTDRFGVLFASEMGVHADERIGFRRVVARINRYLWRNEAMA